MPYKIEICVRNIAVYIVLQNIFLHFLTATTVIIKLCNYYIIYSQMRLTGLSQQNEWFIDAAPPGLINGVEVRLPANVDKGPHSHEGYVKLPL